MEASTNGVEVTTEEGSPLLDVSHMFCVEFSAVSGVDANGVGTKKLPPIIGLIDWFGDARNELEAVTFPEHLLNVSTYLKEKMQMKMISKQLNHYAQTPSKR